jgi:hypothetical protein
MDTDSIECLVQDIVDMRDDDIADIRIRYAEIARMSDEELLYFRKRLAEECDARDGENFDVPPHQEALL